VEAVVDGDVAAARARATERLVTLRAALEAMLS
jgi:hypothetical protein